MIIALVSIFAGSFLLGFSGAMMPGPLLTATISESSRRGPFTGTLMMVGHGILELTLLAALLLGLAPILKMNAAFIVISIAGAVILFWMATGMLRSLPGLTISWEASEEKPRLLLATGALMSVANPYWTIWWATIGLGYILQCEKYGMAGIAAFFVGHILADITWYTAISIAVWKGKKFLSDRLYRILIGGCAVFLLCFGGWFLVSGIQRFLTN